MKTHAILLPVLAMILSSCVSISYKPINLDSPPLRSDALCKIDKPTLEKGESCMFLIRADQTLTRTSLKVEKDQTYRITVPKDQVWYDLSRRNEPPNGERGSWMMNLFKHWKRIPDSSWFALIAANVRSDKTSTEPYECQDVSADADLKFEREGQLAFFPNDVIMPVFGNHFYSNNSGQVWVQIEYCADACKTLEPTVVENRKKHMCRGGLGQTSLDNNQP